MRRAACVLFLLCALAAAPAGAEVYVIDAGPDGGGEPAHRLHHTRSAGLRPLLAPLLEGGQAGGHRQRGWPAHAQVTAPGHPATVVTALYNIKRDDPKMGDGRKMDEYKEWFAETLSIVAPMVVFVGDPDLAEFAKARRSGHAPTRIVMLPFEQLPLYDTLDIIRAAQKSEKWLACRKFPDRLENKLAEYVVLVNSKLQMMAWAAEANPFDSSYFMFMDAGIARWSGAVTQAAGVRKPFPNMDKVRKFDPDGDKLLVQVGVPSFANLTIPGGDWFKFCCAEGDGFNGGVMGGSGEAVEKMARAHHKLFLHEVLPAQAVANEQMVLMIMYARKPALFALIPQDCPKPDCAPRLNNAISGIDWLA